MTYLDAASAAPLHPVAREALLGALDDGWADPARLYGAARRAQLMLDGAREQVAEVLGARPDEVSFTASGTQAAQLAVLGALAGRRRAGDLLVASAVEHSCVLLAGRWHEAAGGRLALVPVDEFGRADPAGYDAVAGDGTALGSLQSANHEVGTVQPVAEVAQLLAARGVPLHVDAAQSLGRVPVPPGWSLLSASAHKWGGPPGVGVLVVRTGTRWRSPMPTDEREGGRVPGVPNVPAVLAAAASLAACAREAEAEATRLWRLVERIRAEVPRLLPDVQVVGDPTRRLPHLVTFSLLYLDGEALLSALDRLGFAVSSGSSCTSSTLEPSHVLAAMGALTSGNIRVSLHAGSTDDDVDRLLHVLPDVVGQLRRSAGVEGL